MSDWLDPDGYLRALLTAGVESSLRQADCRPGSSVIDIGSGSQPYRRLVESLGATYVPCDIGAGRHIEIVPGKPLALERNSFDIGLSIQVLEHVWDIDEYLALFRSYLKPNGCLIISTHGVWPFHPHPTDYRRWTEPGLRRELESRGFVVEGVGPLMGPLAWTTQFRVLGIMQLARRAGRAGSIAMAPLSFFANAWMWLEDQLTPSAIRYANACVYLMKCRIACKVPAIVGDEGN